MSNLYLDNSSSVGSASTAAREATSLTWLSDQMHAAVGDLMDAWDSFKFGARPVGPASTTSGQQPPPVGTRLDQMSDLVRHIRGVAEDIRSRA